MGTGHPDPEIRRGAQSPKNFFWRFGSQFLFKIRVGRGGGGKGQPGPSFGPITVKGDLPSKSVGLTESSALLSSFLYGCWFNSLAGLAACTASL